MNISPNNACNQWDKQLPLLRFTAINPLFYPIVFICFVFVFSGCEKIKKLHIQPLISNWTLNVDALNPALAVKVPGLVHTDLLSARLIENPFFGLNEASLQYIGKRSWEYSLQFSTDDAIWKMDNIQLVFEGLDTYAEVKLNDELILKTENMFRQYQTNVKQLLKKTNNTLHIKFFPLDSIIKQKANDLPYKLPEERAFVRKAPFQFGWDWAPTYVTMGIWKPVFLQAWNGLRVLNHTIHQQKVNQTEAQLSLEVEIESCLSKNITIELWNQDNIIIAAIEPIQGGSNTVEIPFRIKNPELWWPNGMGKQHLYTFTVRIVDGNEVLNEQQLKLGLRTIELIQKVDAFGESFYFQINDHPLFIKGANFIPVDHFLSDANSQKTKKLLFDAKKAHMNMIRVWGGGIYPDDNFYHLCDSLGLLVWQDFMFACTMYPFDNDFLDNVSIEATQQIKRLRKFTSIALWCGNNEVSEGFHNWGWQKSLHWSAGDSAQIWNGYLRLFEQMLPALVKNYDKNRLYWPSSPSIGWGRSESLKMGDVHYWGVWWGEEPFEMYEQKVGRFHSEYGFQAMPNMATINYFTDSADRFLGSKALEAHQKHPRGTKLIDMYMQRDFPVPSQLGAYVYVSQLLQSYGVSKAIEAHRRNMPYTMGTLFWQLNDCWPVTSWSSIDYFGRWKALHYHLGEVYAPVLISATHTENAVNIYVVNDMANDLPVTLEMQLKSFDGSILKIWKEHTSVRKVSSQIVKSISKTELLSNVDPRAIFLHCRLMANNVLVTEKWHYFDKPKNLKLKKASPQMKINIEENYIELTLSTQTLIKNLMLQCNDTDGFFENNFFDLIPATELKVKFFPSEGFDKTKLKFETMALNQMVGNTS